MVYVDLEIANAKGCKGCSGISKMKRIRAELVKADSYSVKMDRVEKVVHLETVFNQIKRHLILYTKI